MIQLRKIVFYEYDKLEFHSTERRNRINSPYSTLRGCDS